MSFDYARIAAGLNEFWAEHGFTVIASGIGLVGLIVLTLFTTGVVRIARSKQRDRWFSGLTALVVLAWTSEGLWEVTRYTLGLPVAFAVMTFFVFEAMMLSSAMQAERHRRRHGTPGPAGRYVWVLATLTAAIVAMNSATMVEALLRFALPLAAAGLWWVGITAERDDDTANVREAREQEAARRAATWAVTPRSVLVSLGLMRPGDQTVTDAERERRIRRMVVTADRLHTAPDQSRAARRAAARLRRLARLASAEDIAEVRDRTARATSVVELVLPGADITASPLLSGTDAPGDMTASSGPDVSFTRPTDMEDTDAKVSDPAGAARVKVTTRQEAAAAAPRPAPDWDNGLQAADMSAPEADRASVDEAKASRWTRRPGKRGRVDGGGTAAQRIAAALAEDPTTTAADLARVAGVTKRHVRRVLADMSPVSEAETTGGKTPDMSTPAAGRSEDRSNGAGDNAAQTSAPEPGDNRLEALPLELVGTDNTARVNGSGGPSPRQQAPSWDPHHD